MALSRQKKKKKTTDYICVIVIETLIIMQLKAYPSLDAKLSDITLGTSAAPTLLPPYYFENDGTEFNLVDGAAAANNPVNKLWHNNYYENIICRKLKVLAC